MNQSKNTVPLKSQKEVIRSVKRREKKTISKLSNQLKSKSKQLPETTCWLSIISHNP